MKCKGLGKLHSVELTSCDVLTTPTSSDTVKT